MKNLLFIFCLLLCITCSYAQPKPAILSIEGFGGEKDEGIYLPATKMSDGDFVIVYGSNSLIGNLKTSCPLGNGLTIFKKYSADGLSMIWEKCMSNNYPDSGYSYLFETQNGQYVLGGVGQSATLGGRHWRMRKEDANGNILWSKVYGGSLDEFLRGMVATTDGGYIMYGESNSSDGDVGFQHSTNPFQYDFWILKLDGGGNILWSKVVGGSRNEQASAVVAAPEGGCYIIGATFSDDYDCTGLHTLASSDAYVARLDGMGNLKWHRCLGGSSGAYGMAGCENGNGGVLIAAFTESADGDVHHHIGQQDIWVINLDSSNNILWDNCYGGPGGNERPEAICRATDGSIWIGGFSDKKGGQVDASYGAGDAWIVKTDHAGDITGSRVLGATGADRIMVMYPLSNGAVLAGGYYEAPGPPGGEFPSVSYGDRDIFLATFAPWTTTIQSTNPLANILSVYPNPATDHVVFGHNVSTPVKNLQLTVTNMTGQVVKKFELQNIAGESWWDTRTVPAGVYIYKLSDAGRQVDVGKVVITR